MRKKTDLAANGFGLVGHVEAVDLQPARTGACKRGGDFQERGLAGAVFPEQCQKGSGWNLQRETAQGGEVAVRLRNAVSFKGWYGGHMVLVFLVFLSHG